MRRKRSKAVLAALSLCAIANTGSAVGRDGIHGSLLSCPTESFDDVAAPALPNGWVFTNGGTGDGSWVTVGDIFNTPPNAAHAPDLPAPNDLYLDTPTFVPLPNSSLTFRNNYNFQGLGPAADGAVLEISINDGVFTDILGAGGSFTQGGYNNLIIDASNPLAGRSVWGGSTNGSFVTTTVVFPSSAYGQPTRLRFRTADNASGTASGNSGWWIDTITCDAPTTPTLSKAFSPTNVDPGQPSTVTLTLGNPINVPATLVTDLADQLPAGLTVATPPNAATTCPNGSVAATAGDSAFSLSTGAGIPAASPFALGTCTVAVDVVPADSGIYVNTITGDSLQTDVGSATGDASAALSVSGPPTLTKGFSPATITVGDTSTITVTIANPNAEATTTTADLTDQLPDGLVIAAIPHAGGNCTQAFLLVATPGANSFTLPSGVANIPANGSCTVKVDVTASTSGTYTNTLPPGALQTGQGSNTAAASATLIVNPIGELPSCPAEDFDEVMPPAMPIGWTAGIYTPWTTVNTIFDTPTNSAFAPDQGQTSAYQAVTPRFIPLLDWTLTFRHRYNLEDGHDGAVLQISIDDGDFQDVIAAGGQFLTGGYNENIFSIPYFLGQNVWSGSTGGAFITTTVALPPAAVGHTTRLAFFTGDDTSGTAPGDAGWWVDTITCGTVPDAPTVSKTFAPETVDVGMSSTVTLTLGNTNAIGATLVAPLTDALPAHVVVAAPPMASSTCPGGTLQAVSGATSFALLAGAQIPASGSCTVSVDVVSDRPNAYTNTIHIGALQTDSGSNANAASATLTVLGPVATVLPEALSLSVIQGGTTSAPLAIANTGVGMLTWSITENPASRPEIVLSTQNDDLSPMGSGQLTVADSPIHRRLSAPSGFSVASWSPLEPVGDISFFGDDGSYEDAANFGDSSTQTQVAAVWLNRFTPPAGSFPLTIDHILITWPNASFANGDLTGEQVRLLVYGDPDGDGDPTNAILLGQQVVTIGAIDSFEDYPVNITVPGPTGDVLIAFEDMYAEGGVPLWTFPAALDETSSHQRSWLFANLVPPFVPDMDNLGNNQYAMTVDNLGAPGNWLIRATASNACANPTDVPWLSEAPTSGSVASGDSEDTTVSVDATTLDAGTYTAHLCVATNDSEHAIIDVPVNLTVSLLPPSPPTIGKAFAPDEISTGGVSALTITLANDNATAATLISALVDTLPSSVAVADPPNASTTCSGGAVTANSGATVVSLSSGASIPAAGNCTVTVPVTSTIEGTYTNTIPANALQTNFGSNADPASAVLIVTQSAPPDYIFANGFEPN